MVVFSRVHVLIRTHLVHTKLLGFENRPIQRKTLKENESNTLMPLTYEP